MQLPESLRRQFLDAARTHLAANPHEVRAAFGVPTAAAPDTEALVQLLDRLLPVLWDYVWSYVKTHFLGGKDDPTPTPAPEPDPAQVEDVYPV